MLALPVAGPWCKAADALRYAKAVKPRHAFPVHDAVLSGEGTALTHGLCAGQLKESGISFIPLKTGEVCVCFNNCLKLQSCS